MATLLPAWEMMEGEAVEIFALTFKYPLAKVAQMALLKKNLYYKPNRALVLPPFKFRLANPTSVPSLELFIFVYIFIGIHELAEKLGFVTFLIKQKSKSPSAASRGKPAQRVKPTCSYNCY